MQNQCKRKRHYCSVWFKEESKEEVLRECEYCDKKDHPAKYYRKKYVDEKNGFVKKGKELVSNTIIKVDLELLITTE